MELYLDSANFKEIEAAFRLGFLTGLTTTPTFMHRDGITDIDGAIIRLSKMVPILQVEALGNSAEEVLAEAERILSLGLDKNKTVFKIPVSLEGVRACRMLVDKGLLVNVHLIYTVQQSYLAMAAGATYVCPLVGRLQDQGHDALGVIRQSADIANKYGYKSKVMFSSVRNVEHVRNAAELGAHAVTVPWGILKQMASNHFTEIGTQQFIEHTRLMSVSVQEAMHTANVMVNETTTIQQALVQMTLSRMGAVVVLAADGSLKGVFTDGDLRRLLENNGGGSLEMKLESLPFKSPIAVEASMKLYDASLVFKDKKVDTLVVTENGKAVGLLDIQDLVAAN